MGLFDNPGSFISNIATNPVQSINNGLNYSNNALVKALGGDPGLTSGGPIGGGAMGDLALAGGGAYGANAVLGAPAAVAGTAGASAAGAGAAAGAGIAGGSLLPSLVSGGLSLAGVESMNASNQSINSANNAFNASQAEINRSFQASQAANAMQTRVADLKAAGLNPASSYANGGTGATAMSGSSASAASPIQMQNSIGSMVSSAFGQAKLSSELEQLSNQNALLRNQALNTAADTTNKVHSTAAIDASVPYTKAQTEQSRASAISLTNKAILDALAIPKASNEAGYESSPFGTIMPYFSHVFGTASDVFNALKPLK